MKMHEAKRQQGLVVRCLYSGRTSLIHYCFKESQVQENPKLKIRIKIQCGTWIGFWDRKRILAKKKKMVKPKIRSLVNSSVLYYCSHVLINPQLCKMLILEKAVGRNSVLFLQLFCKSKILSK